MGDVLVIGGLGRIGAQVARDILHHTDARVTLTGRQITPVSTLLGTALPSGMIQRCAAIALDLGDHAAVERAIASHDVVIHCAGPFHYRDTHVLERCIASRTPYLDVSDCAPFTRKALTHHAAAQATGITAIINTGVFPGISNSMARLCVEGFERHAPQSSGQSAQTIRLYYAVAGSGGAGVTVLRTTFLGLQHPFHAWIEGQWQPKRPYSDRQTITFPSPYGNVGVYWYEVPETLTLAQTFPVKTVVTKFGSVPNLYNILTWIVAHWFPPSWIQSPTNIEALSHVSYRMTQVSDRLSGTGIAMRVEVTGDALAHPSAARATDQPTYWATMVHPNTAIAAGAGTGSLAQLLLEQPLTAPGVHPVESAISTAQFQTAMEQRNITISHGYSSASGMKD